MVGTREYLSILSSVGLCVKWGIKVYCNHVALIVIGVNLLSNE